MKELLATLGVGLTSQYVEQIGRKVLGALLGKIGGGLLGSMGSVATGAGFSLRKYAGQIADGARSLDLSKLLSAVRT